MKIKHSTFRMMTGGLLIFWCLATMSHAADDGAGGGVSGADSDASLAFAEIVVPQPKGFVGEAIPTELRVYLDSRGRWQFRDMPTLTGNGFTAQKMTQPSQSRVTKDGKEYDLVVFKTAITPVKSGKIQIGPIEIQAIANLPQKKRAPQRFGLPDFDDWPDAFGGFSRAQQVPIKAEAMTIEVKPLPTMGQPKSFSGAVGRYAMTVDGNPKKVSVGDPITMVAKVTGRGNFDRMKAPTLQDENGWKSYPPSEKFVADDDVGISGTKTFEMLVMPNEKKSTLPVAEFSYFDPSTEKYVTLNSKPVPIIVEGEIPRATPQPALAAVSPALTAAPKVATPDEILYIRTDAGKSHASFRPIYESRVFWLAQGAPLATLLAFFAMRILGDKKRNRVAQRDTELRREKNRLRGSITQSDDAAEVFSSATRYLQADAALVMGKSLSEIGMTEVRQARKIDSETQEQIGAIFETHNQMHYAGVAVGGESLAQNQREEILQTLRTFENSTPNV